MAGEATRLISADNLDRVGRVGEHDEEHDRVHGGHRDRLAEHRAPYLAQQVPGLGRFARHPVGDGE